MNKQEKQFHKSKDAFLKKSLSDTQKKVMLSRIYDSAPVAPSSFTGAINTYFMFFRQKTFVTIASLILLLSGTAFASAHSLPNDLLYGVKVNVIEPIGLAFRFSEESKNEYKISLLEKRLDEIKKLEDEEKLNKKTEIKSSKAANKNIKDLEKSSIFNKDGENKGVAKKINNYNTIVSDEFKIETNIIINTDTNVDVSVDDLDNQNGKIKIDSKIENDVNNVIGGDKSNGLRESINKGLETNDADNKTEETEGPLPVDVDKEIEKEIKSNINL